MDQFRRLTKLVDAVWHNDPDKAMGPQQILIFIKAAEEEGIIVCQRGDALDRYPKIVAGYVAISTTPAVACKGLGISVPLADELTGIEGGLVVNLVEASSKEPLPYPLVGSGATHDQHSKSHETYSQKSVFHRGFLIRI